MEILPIIFGVLAYLAIGSFTAGIIAKVCDIDFNIDGDYFIVGCTLVMWPIALVILSIYSVGKLSYDLSSWFYTWCTRTKK
jgi:hypothetical protein